MWAFLIGLFHINLVWFGIRHKIIFWSSDCSICMLFKFFIRNAINDWTWLSKFFFLSFIIYKLKIWLMISELGSTAWTAILILYGTCRFVCLFAFLIGYGQFFQCESKIRFFFFFPPSDISGKYLIVSGTGNAGLKSQKWSIHTTYALLDYNQTVKKKKKKKRYMISCIISNVQRFLL